MASGFGVLDMALDDVISQNRTNKRRPNNRTIRGGVSKTRGTRPSNKGNSFSELFGQIGSLKRAFLHIAPSGKSSGVADIVFVRPNDAERARATYNNVELDGRPMRISFAAAVPAATASAPSGRGPSGPRRTNDRPARGGNRGGRRQRESRPKASEQDLDAQMDNYMSGSGVASDTEEDAGTSIIPAKLSDSKQTFEELEEFYKIRAQIEKEYGEKLLQLSKHMVGRAEQGFFADALFHIPVAIETTARAHADLAQQMHDHLETPLQTFSDEQAKKGDSQYQHLETLQDRCHQQHTAVVRAKDDYMGETMKLAGMEKFLKERGHELPEAEASQIKEDIEESKHMVAAADNVYRQTMEDWNQSQEAWDADRRSTYDALRTMEQQRLEFVQCSLLTFAKMLSNVGMVNDQNCNRIRTAMETMDIPKDMQRFDQDIGISGEEITQTDTISNVFKEVEDMLSDVVPTEQSLQEEDEEKDVDRRTATPPMNSQTIHTTASSEVVANAVSRSQSPEPTQNKFKPVPNPAFQPSAAVAVKEEELSDDESVVLPPQPKPKEEKWMISTRRQPQQLPVMTQNAHIYDRQSVVMDPKRLTNTTALHIDPLLTKPARPVLKIDIPNNVNNHTNGIAPQQEAKQVIESVRAQLRQAGSTVEKRRSKSPEKPRFSLGIFNKKDKEKRKSTEQIRPPVEERSPVLHHARAKWPYEAKMDQEISFLYGDVVAVFHKQADGWWDAEIMDAKRKRRGLVPGNYMEII
ncbi:hypothetical protein DFQ28_000756 [Apophysomyces sp. BC1034]|nr:hypothetical protein DFQ29_005625 [Apophysomyces sp. BC1021]KAG0191209.1 hypothetical protein DFQ28_000756 [Apophysomyces sp. BC1034]